MEHYVTLFDSLFLPQGIALHSSMERHVRIYTLWILCIDDITHDVLSRLGLTNIRLIKLSDVETSELTRVKSERTRAEYCWTLTPFTPRFVFEADESIQRVTYIDADLWFRKNPAPIFKELEESGKQILITEHAYAPEYDQSETSGIYCVQFVTFTREGGESVRQWWEERCIEWCYARFEDGKFGDQKYLDDWPERFSEKVHVLNRVELLLAPWNASRFPYNKAIVYHFHSLRLLSHDRVYLGDKYFIPEVVVQYIYHIYLIDINRSIMLLNNNNHTYIAQAKCNNWSNLKNKILQYLYQYNYKEIRNLKTVIKLNKFN